MAARSKMFAMRAAKAAVHAIAIYNQPHNAYREEAFSILVVNAWELLLKAKIIKDNRNRLESIYVYVKQKDSSRKTIKRNRSKTPMTLGVLACLNLLRQQASITERNVQENIELLVEIRDNSTHFLHNDPALTDRVFRIGTASLRNFFKLYEEWFGHNPEFDFAPIPLAFNAHNVDSVSGPKKSELKKLVEYLDAKLAKEEKSEFSVAVQMQVTFTKESKGSGIGVRLTNDPSAPEVRLSEEDILARYPLDYAKLQQRIREKLPGIKINKKFTAVMRDLRADPSLCHTRYLNISAKKGEKKLYSEAVLSKLENARAKLDFSPVR